MLDIQGVPFDDKTNMSNINGFIAENVEISSKELNAIFYYSQCQVAHTTAEMQVTNIKCNSLWRKR